MWSSRRAPPLSQHRHRAAGETFHLGRRADRAEVAQLELDEAPETRPNADDRIDARGLGHPLSVIAAPEGHRVEGKPADRDLAAKMIGVRPHLTNVVDAHVTQKEVRPGIPGPAWLERRELERALARGYLRCDLGARPARWDGPLAVEPPAHEGGEGQGEGGA